MNKKGTLTVDFKVITVKEFLYPEDHMFIEAQSELYPKDINALRNSKPLLKTNNLLSLQPFLSDNVLQIEGAEWTNNFTILFEAPNILSKNYLLSALLA